MMVCHCLRCWKQSWWLSVISFYFGEFIMQFRSAYWFFLYSFCVPVPGKLENNWFNVVKGYLKILPQSALIIHRHIPKGIVVSHKNCMWVSKDKWIFKTTRCCSERICRKLASFRCYFSYGLTWGFSGI